MNHIASPPIHAAGTMQSRPSVQIVIPAYRSAVTIGPLIKALLEVLNDYPLKILIVDDCSTDGTRDEILRLAAKHPQVQYYFSHQNNGQQESLRVGLRLADPSFQYVVTMDDDGQHPAEVVPLLLEKAQQGFDLVYAVPYTEGYFADKNRDSTTRRSLITKCGFITERHFHMSRSPMRIAGSFLRDVLFSFFINKPKGIRVSSFRVMTRALAETSAASCKRYFYLSAEAFQYPLTAANIYYPYQERASGRTGYTAGKLVQVYLRLLFTYKIKILP